MAGREEEETKIGEEEKEGKWEGKASADLKGATPQQVWPFLEDFCNLHKWFPSLDTCYQVDGVAAQPGLIRYCASTATSGDDAKIMWARERLVEIDPVGRWLSYEVLDNNMGLNNYVATAKVLPLGDGGCKIEWCFVCDPVDGLGLDDLVAYLDSCIHFMASKIMENVLQLNNCNLGESCFTNN